jgi:hypothetical protein
MILLAINTLVLSTKYKLESYSLTHSVLRLIINNNYRITEPGLVSLKIFDSMGTKVSILVNERKPVGDYSIEWNAAGLGSGIYSSKLQNGSYNESMKTLTI